MNAENIKAGLPKGLTLTKEGYWLAESYHNGTRRRKRLGRISSIDREYALIKFHNFKSSLIGNDPLPVELKGFDRRYFSVVYRKAKDRAAKRGQPFALSELDFQKLLERCGGKCEVTGLEFSEENPTNARVRPFVPSLDRIDSRKSYSFENCRFVCAAVNLALMDFGEKIFDKIATSYAAKKLISAD